MSYQVGKKPGILTVSAVRTVPQEEKLLQKQKAQKLKKVIVIPYTALVHVMSPMHSLLLLPRCGVFCTSPEFIDSERWAEGDLGHHTRPGVIIFDSRILNGVWTTMMCFKHI